MEQLDKVDLVVLCLIMAAAAVEMARFVLSGRAMRVPSQVHVPQMNNCTTFIPCLTADIF